MMEHQTLTELIETQETLIIETLTALMKVLKATIATMTLGSLITKLIKRTMDSTAIITIIIRNRKDLKIMKTLTNIYPIISTYADIITVKDNNDNIISHGYCLADTLNHFEQLNILDKNVLKYNFTGNTCIVIIK